MKLHRGMMVSDILRLGDGAEAVFDWYGVALDDEDLIMDLVEVCEVYGLDAGELLSDLAATLGLSSTDVEAYDADEDDEDWDENDGWAARLRA